LSRPVREEAEFRSVVLSELGADHILDSAATHYWTLGEIIGIWFDGGDVIVHGGDNGPGDLQ
jgi:hypothetical protein